MEFTSRTTVTFAVVLLATLAALPAPAQADWRIDRAKAVADTVWHHPCGDRPVEIVWEPLTDADAQVHDDERPPYPVCRVHFNSATTWPWLELCSYMIHEYGHLANFSDPLNPTEPEHSHNDYSIMSALFVTDKRCEKRGRPFLQQHRVPRPRLSVVTRSRLAPNRHQGEARLRASSRPRGKAAARRPPSAQQTSRDP